MTTYTMTEEKLLKLIKKRKGKPISSNEIVEIHYADGPRPKFPRQSVVVVLNRLVVKTKKTKKKDGFALYKSGRNGPNPNMYWVE